MLVILLRSILCFILIICNLHANSPEAVLSNRKFATPFIENSMSRPENFEKSNNLLRKAGSPFRARGEYLYIHGYVTDLLGVPMDNVIIYIWQANLFGYYNHIIKNKDDQNKYDIDFVGNGIAITDNLGFYSFVTIVPGYYGDKAPHVNFLIKHDNMPEEFTTQMFFPGHPRNIYDPDYLSFNGLNKDLLTAKTIFINEKNAGDGKIALFNIKLNALYTNKTY